MAAAAGFAAVNAVLARAMDPAEFGRFAVLASIATVGGMVISGGVNRTLLRRIAAALALDRPDEVARDLHAARPVLAGSAALGLVGTVAAAVTVGGARGATIAATAAMAAGLGAVVVGADVLRGFGEHRVANLLSGRNGGAPAMGFTVALALTLGRDRLDAAGALWISAAALVVMVPVLLLTTAGERRRHAIPVVGEGDAERALRTRAMVGPSISFGGAQVAYFLGNQVDLWIGGIDLAGPQVGAYAAALRLMTLVSLPLNAAQLTMAARVAALHAQGREEEMERVVRRTATLITAPAVLMLVPCVVLPGTVLGVLFGENYRQGAFVLAALGLGQLVNVVTGLCGTVLSMTAHERIVLWVNGIGLVVSVVADVVGVRVGGIDGLATASALTTSATFITLWILARRLTGTWTHPGAVRR